MIGDSISIGYTVPVREMLKNVANVHRPKTNCGPTTKGVAELDRWLGDRKWDVIHFNFGLHDLKYMGKNGENLADPNDPESKQQVPPDEYRGNLQKIVAVLKTTDAKLIWRNTTPVPDGAKGRVPGDSAKYNEIAAEIMNEHGIVIDDQFSFAMKNMKEIQQPANVHFSQQGLQEACGVSTRPRSRKHLQVTSSSDSVVALTNRGYLLLVPTAFEQKHLFEHCPHFASLFHLCGFGLAVASARATSLICQSTHRPKGVVLLGIAGSLRAEAVVGDAYCFENVHCSGIGVGQGSAHQTSSEMGWSQWPAVEGSCAIGDRLELDPVVTSVEKIKDSLLSWCRRKRKSRGG